jgi:triacylglycerol lipase
VVRWQSCVADYAMCVEVRGSHFGLAFNRHAYRAVAEALAVPATDE